MTSAVDVLEHPLVRVAQRVIRRGADDSFELDEKGAALIQRGLMKYANDPSLPTAIEGLFALVTGLFDRAQSPTAARRLLEVLVSTRDYLPALAFGRNTRTTERVAEGMRRLQGEPPPTAPMHHTSAPLGSVPVTSLTGISRFRR